MTGLASTTFYPQHQHQHRANHQGYIVVAHPSLHAQQGMLATVDQHSMVRSMTSIEDLSTSHHNQSGVGTSNAWTIVGVLHRWELLGPLASLLSAVAEEGFHIYLWRTLGLQLLSEAHSLLRLKCYFWGI